MTGMPAQMERAGGYGLLAPDWRGVANPRVPDMLKAMIPPRTGPGVS